MPHIVEGDDDAAKIQAKESVNKGARRAMCGECLKICDPGLRLKHMRDSNDQKRDRSENLRRSAHVAKLINDNGLICLGAFVAPSQLVRERVADVIGKDRFITIHCTASESICRKRDTKGHYASAEAGKLANFPGVSAIYEPPENPDLVLDTGDLSVEECVSAVLELLKANQIIR